MDCFAARAGCNSGACGSIIYTTMSFLLCYKLQSRLEATEELLWSYVQRVHGYMSIRDDHILFWVPEGCESLFLLLGGDLARCAGLDYVD